MIEAAKATTKAMTVQEALAWSQACERRITVTEAAQIWGWEGDAGRVKAGRYLQSWSKGNKLEVCDTTDGKKLIRPNIAVQPASWYVRVLKIVAPYFRIDLARIMAMIATALALAALYVSMQVTADYGKTLGRSESSVENFAQLSMICEAVAFFTPSFFDYLMEMGRKRLAWMAWVPFVIATAWTLQAAFGYASINVADTMAGRSGVTERRIGVEDELKKTREAKAERQKKDARTEGQLKVKTDDIASFDRTIGELEAKLATMPVKVSMDPQTEAATKIFGISPERFTSFRTLSITALPHLSGFVLALAIGLWRGKRENEKSAKTVPKKTKRTK